MDNIKEKNVCYNMIDVMKLIMSFLVVMIHKPLISLSHPFPKFILEENRKRKQRQKKLYQL